MTLPRCRAGLSTTNAVMQGLLMTAYLKWRGMLEATLGLYRAAGALAGIGATLCFSALHARLGAVTLLSSPASSETPGRGHMHRFLLKT